MQWDAQKADFVWLWQQLHSADAAELHQGRNHIELVVDDLTHPILGSHQQADQHLPVLKLNVGERDEAYIRKENERDIINVSSSFN